MYIIDQKSDYYDHYSYIYGVDKKVVYDRRESSLLNNLNVLGIAKAYNPVRGPDAVRFLLLEIGLTQHLLKLSDFILEGSEYKEVVDYSMEIVRTFQDFKHRHTTPLSIVGVQLGYRFLWKEKGFPRRYITQGSYDEVIHKVFDNRIDNPILANTKVTSLIDGEEVWKELQNYISSLNNDRDVSTPMTDVERAEIHGFDKKTSFRNPIK